MTSRHSLFLEPWLLKKIVLLLLQLIWLEGEDAAEMSKLATRDQVDSELKTDFYEEKED
jgi:hypothetical protein